MPHSGILADVPNETRRAVRSDVALVARVLLVSTTLAHAELHAAAGVAIQDLSVQGLSFLTNDGFLVGDMLEVRLSLQGAEIIIHGIVRNVRDRTDSAGIQAVGVHFLPSPSTKSATETLGQWLSTITVSSAR